MEYPFVSSSSSLLLRLFSRIYSNHRCIGKFTTVSLALILANAMALAQTKTATSTALTVTVGASAVISGQRWNADKAHRISERRGLSYNRPSELLRCLG